MSLFRNSHKYIDDDLKGYYNNQLITQPVGHYNIRDYYNDEINTSPFSKDRTRGYDYTEFTLNLIFRYLTDKSEYNIMVHDGFLFNKRRGYSKLRKKIFEEYHCPKITRVPGNMRRNIGVNRSILTIKRRTQPKIYIDSFQLLEFIKIISSDLFQSMDYDVYLTIIKHLKTIFEYEKIEYSKLQMIDNNITETEQKTIYLKDVSFNKYYRIGRLIH